MIASRQRGTALRIAALTALALFALAPLLGSARATSIDDDLKRLTARLQEFRTRVRGGELTEKGIRLEAQRIIALKRDFVLSSEDKSDVFLEPYLDLARINDAFERASERAHRPRAAHHALEDAIVRIQGLAATLGARTDSADYSEAVDCLGGLRKLASTVAAEETETALRKGAKRLVDRKLTCISTWPPVFGANFQVTYGELERIDDVLEELSDRRSEGRATAVRSLDVAIEDASSLRRRVAAWAAAPSPSPTSSASPSPNHSASPTASPSASPSASASPTQSPTPEESPTGINPQPPQVGPITASFDPDAHRTVYSVTASDPDGDSLTFTWSKTNERDCGTFGGAGRTAVWTHDEPPCPVESFHPGTISVFVSDGTYTCSAFYDGGSASGSGTPADCGLAPRP